MRLIDAEELTEMAWRERLDTRERIVNLIARQPTIKAKPVKHGKWIAENQDKRGYADCFTCSNCNNYTYTYTLMKVCEHDYCPNCGASMDKS